MLIIWFNFKSISHGICAGKREQKQKGFKVIRVSYVYTNIYIYAALEQCQDYNATHKNHKV